MATWNSISFTEQSTDGWSGPRPNTRVLYTKHHIEATDTWVRVSTGTIKDEFDVGAVVTASALASLISALDSSHALSYSGGSVTCTLVGVRDIKTNALDTSQITCVLRFDPD